MSRPTSEYQINILNELNNGWILCRDSIEDKWFLQKGENKIKVKRNTGRFLIKTRKIVKKNDSDIFNNQKYIEHYILAKGVII